jgi:uncharacterized membrane protein YkvI
MFYITFYQYIHILNKTFVILACYYQHGFRGDILKNTISRVLQISAVFIGTIVGAGLASGREIMTFFTTFGYKSFIGILISGLLYIPICSIVIKISIKHNLRSYNELINLVSPGFLGKITDLIMTFFLISSSAIILAGSGSLLHQYFGVSKWVGLILMAILAIIVLLRDTKGLIEINSVIVPSLIIVLTTLFLLYVLLAKDSMTVSHLKTVPYEKNYWLLSAFVYAGFNSLCCSGVLVPLSSEVRNVKTLVWGVIFGAIGLTALSWAINLMLMLNVPYIHKYDIPLLYIAHRFGNLIQILLLLVIWMEMFSTEVSDIYSVSRTIEHVFKIPFKKAIFTIFIFSVPISQIGFAKLIEVLYPAFGIISAIFMGQCIIFYYKDRIKGFFISSVFKKAS